MLVNPDLLYIGLLLSAGHHPFKAPTFMLNCVHSHTCDPLCPLAGLCFQVTDGITIAKAATSTPSAAVPEDGAPRPSAYARRMAKEAAGRQRTVAKKARHAAQREVSAFPVR